MKATRFFKSLILIFSLISLVLVVSCATNSSNSQHGFIANAPEPLLPVPTPNQLAWHNDELTLFIHFGMNTYSGHSGTGKGDEDPNIFNPTDFDPHQWARVGKECGFKGMILTAKHHDGFCLWPTETTDHSVEKSAWRNGRGDVVKEVADACREEGMKFGIYCSPWDRNQKNYTADREAYANLYRQQLSELLSNYGPIYEMWFDGNKADVKDWPNVIDLTRNLQPDAVIKQGPLVRPIREDVRWVGSEMASAPLANWAVYPTPTSSNYGNRIWFPVECDTPMIGHWFWADTLPHELPFLLDIYYQSVGRGSILLLNVAPDRRGKFSPESVERLREFHAALTSIFGTDLAANKTAIASSVRGDGPTFDATQTIDGDAQSYWVPEEADTNAWVEIDLDGQQTFNVIRMEENISLGQRVAEYQLEVWDDIGETWKLVHKGFTIGHKKLDRIPEVTSSKVRFTVLKSFAVPTISSIGIHRDTFSPKKYFEPELANFVAKPRSRMPKQKPIARNAAEK